MIVVKDGGGIGIGGSGVAMVEVVKEEGKWFGARENIFRPPILIPKTFSSYWYSFDGML